MENKMSILRPVELNDLATLQTWRNNRNLRNNTHGFRFPVNNDMEQAWFENNIINSSPTKAVFAIRSDNNSILGLAQLDAIDAVHRNAKLGIFIGDKNSRGKGYGKTALNELLTFGFNDINLVKIYLYVNSGNTDAISLYEKLNFVTEAVLKKHYYVDGEWENLLIMSKFKTQLIS